MANPTLAKPTGYFAHYIPITGTVSATAICDLPLLGSGCIRDSVRNVLGEPWIGYGGLGFGHPPQVISTGFNVAGLSDPSYKFSAGTTSIRIPDAGWGVTQPTPRTFWCVYKPYNSRNNTPTHFARIIANGADVNIYGLGYSVTSGGIITVGYVGSTFVSSNVILTGDRWYIMSMTHPNNSTALFNVYSYTDQQYLTPSTGITISLGGSTIGSTIPDIVINPSNGTSTALTYRQMLGELYACGVTTGTFDPQLNNFFSGMIVDPCQVSRNTYTGGGPLLAGGCCTWDTTPNSIIINSNKPSGGANSPSQFRLHRSTVPSFTPTGSTAISELQYSPQLIDINATSGVNYYYRVEQTDGLSTVYSTTATSNQKQAVGRLSLGDFFFGVIGNSRYNNQAPIYLAATLRAWGWRTGFWNCTLGSTYISVAQTSLNWQPNLIQDPTNGTSGTSLLANAVSGFQAADVDYVFMAIGGSDLIGATPTGTIKPQLDVINNLLIASGFKIMLAHQYLPTNYSDAAISVFDGYRRMLDSMANNTTIFSVGATSDYLSHTGPEWAIADDLHHSFEPIDGLAMAKDINELFYPTSSITSSVSTTDVYNLNNSNNQVFYSVGVISIPNTGYGILNPMGNISLSDIQSQYASEGHFNR